jgi:hypothetical protein
MIIHERWRIVEAMEEKYSRDRGRETGRERMQRRIFFFFSLKIKGCRGVRVPYFCLAYWSGEMATSLEHTRRNMGRLENRRKEYVGLC